MKKSIYQNSSQVISPSTIEKTKKLNEESQIFSQDSEGNRSDIELKRNEDIKNFEKRAKTCSSGIFYFQDQC